MKKRLLSLVIALFLILSLPMPAFAAQDANIIQSYQISGTEMLILCADPEPGEGQYRVDLGGQELPTDKSTVRKDHIPVTVFCLVDTSGSMSNFKMDLIRGTLTEISESMTDGDNMVIATLGNGVQVGPVLHTHQEREAAIAALSATKEDTNLYAGIVQSMERLVSDTNYNSYGCLVVLSDGVDDQDNGMTEQEVMNAVQSARRPLYSVALIQDTPELEGGKILGSFARSSYGGIHQSTVKEGGTFTVRWDATGAEFGSTIWNSLQGMSVLHTDLGNAQVDFNKAEVRLDVTFLAGSSTYTDSENLPTNQFPGAPEPAPTMESAPETPEQTDGGTGTETVPATTGEGGGEPKSRLILWIGIGAVLILAGVAVLLIVKKKNAPENISEPPGRTFQDGLGVTQGVGVTQGIGATQGVTVTDIPETEGVGPTIPGTEAEKTAPVTKALEQKFKVYMTDIPYGLKKVSFTVKAVEVTTFGRSAKKSQCLLSTDDIELSGAHFSLMLQKDHYLIQDENSTNGTSINGVPISGKGWRKLQSGDKIRAGSYEYRIIIEPEE